MLDPELHRRLAWLIGIRAVVGTVLLGGAIVAQITAPGSFPVDPFFFLIALTYALTVAYATTMRFADRHRWLIDLQLAGDALTVSAVIYFTGGITSFFSSLYVLPIVAASTVQFRRGGLLVATLSARHVRRPGTGSVPGGLRAASAFPVCRRSRDAARRVRSRSTRSR